MKYIIGLGNYAKADDGIGLRIIEVLAERTLPADIGLHDIGNDGLKILTFFEKDTELIVVVDSALLGEKPGDFKVFSPEDVVSEKQLANFSTHEGDILKIVSLARSLDYFIPPIKIFGIEPESLALDQGLSVTLQGRFEEYLKNILSLVIS